MKAFIPLKLLAAALSLFSISGCVNNAQRLTAWDDYFTGIYYTDPRELRDQLWRNKFSFEEKYDDQIIYVRGRVRNLEKDSFSLAHADDRVGCDIRSDSSSFITELETGNSVIAVGRVDFTPGEIFNPIILRDCIWGHINNDDSLIGAKISIRESNYFKGRKVSDSLLKDANEYLAKANILKDKKGREKEAIDLVNKALSIQTSALGYLYRGNAKYNLRDYGDAILDLNKAIEINPKYADLNFYLKRAKAQARKSRSNFRETVNDYTKSIEMDPQNYFLYIKRGFLRQRLKTTEKGNNGYLNDYRGSIKDYTKAIEINPQHILAYILRALAWDYLLTDKTFSANITRQYQQNECDDIAKVLSLAPLFKESDMEIPREESYDQEEYYFIHSNPFEDIKEGYYYPTRCIEKGYLR